MLFSSEHLLAFFKADEDKKNEIVAFQMIDTAQQLLGNTQADLDYYFQAEKEAIKAGLLSEFSNIPYNIGGALLSISEKEKALPYFRESIALCKKYNDKQYLTVWELRFSQVQRQYHGKCGMHRVGMANDLFLASQLQ